MFAWVSWVKCGVIAPSFTCLSLPEFHFSEILLWLELAGHRSVPCAGSGNLALAAGKGMGKPAFRIIQTHFAAANNNGDVAAKEEVRAASLSDALHASDRTEGWSFVSICVDA